MSKKKVLGLISWLLAAVGLGWAGILLVPVGIAWIVSTTQTGWAAGVANANTFAAYQSENPVVVGVCVLTSALILALIGFMATRESQPRQKSVRAEKGSSQPSGFSEI